MPCSPKLTIPRLGAMNSGGSGKISPHLLSKHRRHSQRQRWSWSLYLQHAQFNIGAFCWADPGLDFSQFPIQRNVKSPLRSYFSVARSAFSPCVLPREFLTEPSSGYQPGDTLMVTTNRWATRSIGTQLLDPTGVGRWSGLSYLGKRVKRLTLFTAYRSPRQQHKGGLASLTNNMLYCCQKASRHPMCIGK